MSIVISLGILIVATMLAAHGFGHALNALKRR